LDSARLWVLLKNYNPVFTIKLTLGLAIPSEFSKVYYILAVLNLFGPCSFCIPLLEAVLLETSCDLQLRSRLISFKAKSESITLSFPRLYVWRC